MYRVSANIYKIWRNRKSWNLLENWNKLGGKYYNLFYLKWDRNKKNIKRLALFFLSWKNLSEHIQIRINWKYLSTCLSFITFVEKKYIKIIFLLHLRIIECMSRIIREETNGQSRHTRFSIHLSYFRLGFAVNSGLSIKTHSMESNSRVSERVFQFCYITICHFPPFLHFNDRHFRPFKVFAKE